MRKETVIYRNRELNILITDARVVVSNKTYALSNITSIEAVVKPLNRLPGVIVLGVGLVMLMSPVCYGLSVGLARDDIIYTSLGILFGLGLLAFGLFLVRGAKTRYGVVIVTSIGEVEILSAHDKTLIREMIAALNSAIAQRG